jgi:hypothetical protein
MPEDQAGLAAALITTSFQLGSALGLAVFSGIATSRTSHLLAAHTPPPEALTAGFQRARGCPQNTELCVINDATGTDAKACRSADVRSQHPRYSRQHQPKALREHGASREL